MAAFLAMGGYAAYVWPAYGVAFVILGGLTLLTILRYRRAQRALAALETQRRGARQ